MLSRCRGWVVVEENTNGEAQSSAPDSVRVAARCVRTVVATMLAAATAGAVAVGGHSWVPATRVVIRDGP
jgi:hypothetical protein